MARLTRGRPLKTFAPKNQLPNVLVGMFDSEIRSNESDRTFDQIRSIRFFGAKVSSVDRGSGAPFTPVVIPLLVIKLAGEWNLQRVGAE